MSTSVYARIDELLAAGEAIVVARIVRGEGVGNVLIVRGDELEGTSGDAGLDAEIVSAASSAMVEEESITQSIEGRDVFFDVFPLKPHLIVFGANHVSQPLVTIAKMLGFRVTVCDARKLLATDERFPDADEILLAWPDEAYAQLTIGANSWIVILTHDPKFDEPALVGALKTDARYIGAIGSRKTHSDRRERLRAAGMTDDDIARIHAPIGLDLGGQTPEEMAIAIMGEMIATRYGRSGGALTTQSGGIRGKVS